MGQLLFFLMAHYQKLCLDIFMSILYRMGSLYPLNELDIHYKHHRLPNGYILAILLKLCDLQIIGPAEDISVSEVEQKIE